MRGSVDRVLGRPYIRDVSTTERPSPSLDVILLVALFVAQGAAALVTLGLYKKGGRLLSEFGRSPAGLITVAAGAVCLVAIVIVVRRFRRHSAETRVGATAAVFINAVCVIAGLVSAEVVLRTFSVETPPGEAFAGTVLLPKSWDALVKRNRALLERAAFAGSFLVFDDQLGWVVAKSRGAKDPYRRFQSEEQRKRAPRDVEIYVSSAEGIRSPAVGVSFASRRPAHRVALVGDSFTFGLEVVYEDTWGAHLETALDNDTQVLNFGVDGYGVDQAVRRYERDVVSWRPEIVILGIIADDLRRTMCVYGFLCFSSYGEIPFPKPRFVLDSGALRQLNAPLPDPVSVLQHRSIADVPFVEYDESYEPHVWEWGVADHSYLVRFVKARFPRWPKANSNQDPRNRAAVNTALLQRFIRAVKGQGSIPVVVAFPGRFSNISEAFAGIDVPFIDMTPCVARVPANDRLVFLHYSLASNAAVANCLADTVSKLQRSLPANRY